MGILDIKRLQCLGCGLYYTSPRGVNQIHDEARSYQTYLFPKNHPVVTHVDEETGEFTTRPATPEERLRDIRADLEAICSRLTAANPEHPFSYCKLGEDESDFEYEIQLELPDAQLKSELNTHVLSCPGCGREGYRVTLPEEGISA